MKIHEFELSGRFAHWRRIYTNSSSLTYHYPTRTNIIGLIASILEMGYDTYYGTFSKDKLNVSVAINSQLKKEMMIFNYRSQKTGITQVRCDILSEINNDKIKYIIYLHAKNDLCEELLQKLITKIKNDDFGYGVYLGQRQYKGFIEYNGSYDSKLHEKNNIVNSICLKEDIIGNFDLDLESNKQYNCDLIPLDFDKTRQLIDKGEYVIELNQNEIKMTDNGHILNVIEVNSKFIKFF